MYLATVILDYLVPREAYSDVLRGLLYLVLDQNKCKLLFSFTSKTLYFHFETQWFFFSDDNFFVPLTLCTSFQSEISFHGI
jgi:hypothetical protein